ncbi:MAG TPA: enoyl-CoA hydratase-related protein [Flexivirga sp.]|uniref:enoyl-CoA hydratase/isomerase family protein n=1 Tax=Flexivirga sp. TaxID=1962927 RepID=UPI002B703636|nr:enoyl-CoA hydratase-related protein [Flexivirga sp.]HWC22418.1 enoyl-CoA hydratase-related protein [Flexivirga sp.]
MPTTFVTLRVQDGVGIITVDRPEARNALSLEVQRDLRVALQDAADDDSINCVILTGAGDKVFVAGADVNQLRTYTKHDGLTGRLQRLFDEIAHFDKPTIAAINGYALGGGCELALACDLRIASTRARFGFPETGLSVIPGAGGTQRLSRLVGQGHALDLILSGRFVTADEAHAMGLASRVVSPDALLAEAVSVATSIGAKGPLATRLARIAVKSGLDADLATGLTIERLAQALLHETTDKQEGIAAMLEKRTPTFQGN